MMIPSGFIELTSITDGKKLIIRTDSIEAVFDNDPVELSYGVKPRFTTVTSAVTA